MMNLKQKMLTMKQRKKRKLIFKNKLFIRGRAVLHGAHMDISSPTQVELLWIKNLYFLKILKLRGLKSKNNMCKCCFEMNSMVQINRMKLQIKAIKMQVCWVIKSFQKLPISLSQNDRQFTQDLNQKEKLGNNLPFDKIKLFLNNLTSLSITFTHIPCAKSILLDLKTLTFSLKQLNTPS